jgi:hypothetical protein
MALQKEGMSSFDRDSTKHEFDHWQLTAAGPSRYFTGVPCSRSPKKELRHHEPEHLSRFIRKVQVTRKFRDWKWFLNSD